MNNEAKKWIGYLEHRSREGLGIYVANVGKGYCTVFSRIISRHYRWCQFDGVPWCAVFVHAVAIEAMGKEKARKLLGKPHPGTRVLARRMRRRGRLRDRDYIPNPGDLIFLTNGDGRISHCGIVDRMLCGMIFSIEGNTDDFTGHFEKGQGGAVAVRARWPDDPAIVNYASMKGVE